MKGKVNEELKKHFKPEFLNRVDDTIVFPQLTKPELLQIVDLFVKQLKDRLLDRDMRIEVSPAARERLAEVGYDPTLGARPLRRAMQREIEDRLSERILSAELLAGDLVRVDFVDGQFTFVTDRSAQKAHGETSASAAAAVASTAPTNE
ncbi:hypothetical protein [Leucobacter allii]